MPLRNALALGLHPTSPPVHPYLLNVKPNANAGCPQNPKAAMTLKAAMTNLARKTNPAKKTKRRMSKTATRTKMRNILSKVCY